MGAKRKATVGGAMPRATARDVAHGRKKATQRFTFYVVTRATVILVERVVSKLSSFACDSCGAFRTSTSFEDTACPAVLTTFPVGTGAWIFAAKPPFIVAALCFLARGVVCVGMGMRACARKKATR